ncbi:retrovirus-related pol polyprotein [Moniliophthora roreri MCA 2997]|uniref:Retrovirus-related pol polyprotein n=1 Tax=Moniliophthora roreri (strain MCA 2997) TaxID=1381753 RepID=V2WKZ8_MONRO|nr:retrovirus-related pol polyprotein [Moniliophthora roreri MCA 2997]
MRPDIAFALSQITTFSACPEDQHVQALKHICVYLNSTWKLWLAYGTSTTADTDKSNVSIGYSDADGMSNPDQRSVSGYIYMINQGAVSWSSKQQTIVTLSTTEAKYNALTHAAKEGIWIRSFISKIFSRKASPMLLYTDNKEAASIAYRDKFHTRTKHINIKFHFI